MIDFEKQFGKPGYETGAKATSTLATTFRAVYGWMCAGLALSGVVAWFTALNIVQGGPMAKMLMGHGFMVCVIVELALVMILSAAINKLSTFAAMAMFLLYAAVNGLTLSIIFLAYDLALVQRVFFITAGMFGGLAVWGTVTKGDLSGIGSFFGMALWGLVIGIVVNMFLHSSGLDWALTFAGIIIFTALTMYDAQKIRQLAANANAIDSATMGKLGILGALTLYLDFINLFLYLLRFFGRKK